MLPAAHRPGVDVLEACGSDPRLEAGRAEGFEETVAGCLRRAELERQRETAPDDVRGSRIEEYRDHLAGCARTVRGKGRNHSLHDVVPREELHERADQERVVWQGTERRTNPQHVAGPQFDERGDDGIGPRLAGPGDVRPDGLHDAFAIEANHRLRHGEVAQRFPA